MNEEGIRPRFYAVLPFLFYGLLIAGFLGVSWMKWGDLIVDSGKEWYFPAQLLSGKVLYRDLVWLYGPLVPYLNAFFFWAGGVQIVSLVFSGLLSLLLTVYALHQLAKSALGTPGAVLVVGTFIPVCAFGFYVFPGNYNFMIPYTYAATYVLAFSLWALHFFHRYKENAGKARGLLAVVFLCAALLTRLEIGLVALAAIVLPAVLEWRADPPLGLPKLRQALKIAFISAGAAFLLYLLFFETVLHGDPGTWKSLLDHYSHRGIIEENLTGLNYTGGNLMVWLISGLLYALFAFLFAGGGFLASRVPGPPAALKTRLYILGLALPILGLAYYLVNLFAFRYEAQYRCLPLLCLLVGFQASFNLLKGRNPGRESLVLTLSLFSFFVLLRVFLRVWPGHFGFTLLAPGLIVYYLFFLRMVPGLFSGDRVRLFIRGGFVFLSLVFTIGYVNLSLTGYAKRTLEIESPRGSLLFFPAEPYLSSKQFLDYLRKYTLPDETLAVFPEGIGFNFLADRQNPLTDYIYNPVDLAPSGTSARVMEQLDRDRVTYVALLQRDTSEQGFSSFGKDYGADIMDYILKNYDMKMLFGSYPYTSNRFGIALFKRKPLQQAAPGK